MTRLEPFDDVARLPMPKVSAHLENLSSFSAIKLDIWEHKTGQIQGFEAITVGFRPGPRSAPAPRRWQAMSAHTLTSARAGGLK